MPTESENVYKFHRHNARPVCDTWSNLKKEFGKTVEDHKKAILALNVDETFYIHTGSATHIKRVK